MKLSDYVIDFVARQGVRHIFEFIGGAITHLIDSTVERDDISCVSIHHEQSAAFAAEAYARINGKLGVAMATSGPGALNMVTGIGSCYFDSVPCLFITGQVNTYEYKFDRPIRQIGFQETDIVSVVRPLTKYAEMVVEPHMIRYHLEKAVYLAQAGRPGPVLLDIPMDIQRSRIAPEHLPSFYDSAEYRELAPDFSAALAEVPQVLSLLAQAKRPVVLAGGGVRTAGATEELRQFLDATGVPVVTTLLGVDALPRTHPLHCGMIGSYGNRSSNITLANSDFLLILGARLDSRQTGTRPDTFARAAIKVHVDIDPIELNAKVQADLALLCDVKQFLAGLNAAVTGFSRQDLGPWMAQVAGYRAAYLTESPDVQDGADPNEVMTLLSGYSREGDVITVDVGQNQMWAAQSFLLKTGQRMLISGGMGAMGFALPAALGAVLSAGTRAIVIAGDGGIQVNSQDLETIASHRLPIKIIVFNNSCLGMVRQFQDMYFGGRRQSTHVGYSCPDFVKVARAYGIEAVAVDSLETARTAFAENLADDSPVLIEIRLSLETCVNPKLVVNRPIEDMSPHLDRDVLKEAMLIDLVEEREVPG